MTPSVRAIRALAWSLVPALAAAQSPPGQPQPPGPDGGGPLMWVFVGFAVAAILVAFLVFRWLRSPPERPPLNGPRA